MYFAPERSRTAAVQSADPALRALLEQLRTPGTPGQRPASTWNSMDPAAYDQQLEKLVTDLAIKTRQSGSSKTKK